MKKLKVYSSLVILIMAIMAMAVYGVSMASYKEAHIIPLYFQEAPFIIDIDTLYLKAERSDSRVPMFKSEALGKYVFSISDYEQKNIICVDSIKKLFLLGNVDPKFRHKNPFAYFIDFEPDYFDMAIKMGRFTDNLATHDCLYICVLERLLQENIGLILKNKDWNLQTRLKCAIFSLYEQFETNRYFKKKLKYTKLDNICIKEDISYRYLYHSSISGIDYLFEDLPAEEKGWGLYYYPSVLCNGLNLKVTQVCSDEKGTLYSIDDDRLFEYSVFSHIGNAHYARVATRKEVVDELPSMYSFLSDTENANSIIRKHFGALSN